MICFYPVIVIFRMAVPRKALEIIMESTCVGPLLRVHPPPLLLSLMLHSFSPIFRIVGNDQVFFVLSRRLLIPYGVREPSLRYFGLQYNVSVLPGRPKQERIEWRKLRVKTPTTLVTTLTGKNYIRLSRTPVIGYFEHHDYPNR